MAQLTAAALALLSLPSGGVGGVVGVGGSGKTTTMQAAAEEGFSRGLWPRQVCFDTYAARDRRRWSTGRRDRRPWWPGEQLVTVDELISRNARQLDKSCFRLVVHSPRGERDEAAAAVDFSHLAELALDTEDLVIIGEEFGKYSRAPGAVQLVNTLATGGGHFGIRFFPLCQRVGRIQIDAREAMSVMAIHAIGGDDDYEAIRGRCGRAVADAAKLLRARCAEGCLEEHEHVRVPDPPLRWRQGERAPPTQGERS